MLAADLGLNSVVSVWGDMGPIVVVCAVAGALLWTTPLRRLAGAGAAALALLWLLVCFTPFAAWLGRGLVRRDPPARADAIFVTASSIQDSGGLTSVAMTRLVHGFELLADGSAPVLVLSDLRPPHPSILRVAKDLLEHLGVRGAVEVLGPNGNTHDEAVRLADLARSRGWRRVIVVTSPYHTRRACAVVEHENLAVTCSPSAETGFDVEDPWYSEERRRAFTSAIHERIGWWLYWRRGWIGGEPAASKRD